MMTERPMFSVPHRSVLVGISLLALWVALTAGFVATTSRAPAPTDFERPCGHAEGMTAHRPEAERSPALQRDVAAQARGHVYAERRRWTTPGLPSTPVVPSSTVARRVHEIDVTVEAVGARDEARDRGETILDGGPFARAANPDGTACDLTADENLR